MDKKARIFLTGITVLLVLSLIPIALNEAFAGGVFPRPILPTTGPIGDFRCWDVAGPDPDLGVGIDLRDQFGDMPQMNIGPLVEFCSSVEKRFQNQIIPSPFGEPGQHFTGYDLTANPRIPPEVHSAFLPQFQILIPEFTVSQPFELLVPTIKHFPQFSDNLTDLHYKCYQIEEALEVPLPAFSLRTQFGAEDFPEKSYQAILWCNPAIKNDPFWEPPTFGALIDEHLMCFLDVRLESEFITIENQFTLQEQIPLELRFKEKFCIEALKDFTLSVGGELIPLDSTMVLVAGTHSVAAWMIPVIVSGIGIAIVIARKF